MDSIQHPIRDAAESKTGKKNGQIHAPTRCAFFPAPAVLRAALRSRWRTLPDCSATKTTGRTRTAFPGNSGILITGHAFLIFTPESHHPHVTGCSYGKQRVWWGKAFTVTLSSFFFLLFCFFFASNQFNISMILLKCWVCQRNSESLWRQFCLPFHPYSVCIILQKELCVWEHHNYICGTE